MSVTLTSLTSKLYPQPRGGLWLNAQVQGAGDGSAGIVTCQGALPLKGGDRVLVRWARVLQDNGQTDKMGVGFNPSQWEGLDPAAASALEYHLLWTETGPTTTYPWLLGNQTTGYYESIRHFPIPFDLGRCLSDAPQMRGENTVNTNAKIYLFSMGLTVVRGT